MQRPVRLWQSAGCRVLLHNTACCKTNARTTFKDTNTLYHNLHRRTVGCLGVSWFQCACNQLTSSEQAWPDGCLAALVRLPNRERRTALLCDGTLLPIIPPPQREQLRMLLCSCVIGLRASKRVRRAPPAPERTALALRVFGSTRHLAADCRLNRRDRRASHQNLKTGSSHCSYMLCMIRTIVHSCTHVVPPTAGSKAAGGEAR